MANMYLAEDHVRGECDLTVVGLGFSYNALIDPMLGTGVEARQGVGSSLCQVSVHCYRHSRSGVGRSVLG